MVLGSRPDGERSRTSIPRSWPSSNSDASILIGYRARDDLPKLGVVAPKGQLLLDTNVFINALARRGPSDLLTLVADLSLSFVSGPTMAELSWPSGRLDPSNRDTARVLSEYAAVLSRIAPDRILVPTAVEWAEAGALAGRAARAVAGSARSIRTAFDRLELIGDAVTAVVALAAGATIVTQDADFDLFMQLEPALDVLFYD